MLVHEIVQFNPRQKGEAVFLGQRDDGTYVVMDVAVTGESANVTAHMGLRGALQDMANRVTLFTEYEVNQV